MTEQDKKYANAFRIFCRQVEKYIEDEIPDWLNENPYWEIDGDDGRPAHCPRTTSADAREALCETILNQADDMGFYDFFEFVLHETFNIAMRKENIFRDQHAKLNAETEATLSLVKMQKNILDSMFATTTTKEVANEGNN